MSISLTKKRTLKKPTSKWFVYLLECTNGRLYCGITTDLAKRFQKHSTGKGAIFTRLNRPSRIIAATACKNRSDASKLEWEIKQLTRKEKLSVTSKWPLQQAYPSIQKV